MQSFGIICLICLICCSSHAADDGLDSLLAVQRERAGYFTTALLDELQTDNLDANLNTDIRFLLAYFPLSDLASANYSKHMNPNAFMARQARSELAWGKLYDNNIYRHFVLPHRVSQEPVVFGWRYQFHEELKSRVAGMTMTQAALEVNHWCHEKATFKQTDARDQDPLTTIRSGFGRCEEEMILAICALRSVGIPARACHTPYWAHTDNNHAWVEVWADGAWHYFGACEPEPVLDQAWFTGAAARAMLVVSTAYGDYRGGEPVLKRYGRSTLINSTAVYGDTRHVSVKLLDKDGKPVPNQRVLFSLWNYGTLMPAISLDTDEDGMVRLDCGLGDWFISAGNDDGWALAHNPKHQSEVELVLNIPPLLSRDTEPIPPLRSRDTEPIPPLRSRGGVRGGSSSTLPTAFDYNPPLELPELGTPPLNPPRKRGGDGVTSAETEARGLAPQRTKREIVPKDSLFKARLAREDSLREANLTAAEVYTDEFLSRWMKLGYPPAGCGMDSSGIYEVLSKSRINNKMICAYLVGTDFYSKYIIDSLEYYAPDEAETAIRVLFLSSLKEKDLRSRNATGLNMHLINLLDNSFPVEFDFNDASSSFGRVLEKIRNLDSLSMARFKDYVLCPTIDYESVGDGRAWSVYLWYCYREGKLPVSANEAELLRWLQDSITVEPNPDRLGPLLSPDQCLSLRRGTKRDIERLYVALCRVRGIPARFNEVDGRLERWDDDQWTTVTIFPDEKGEPKRAATGQLSISVGDSDSTTLSAKYFKDWAVAHWETDHLSAVDFGYHEPFDKIEFPKELPVGLYCLTSGIRRADGSAPVKLEWFEVTESDTIQVQLEFRSP